MSEISELTYVVHSISGLMDAIWKRMSDQGKNWRHVYKSLVLLEFLLKTGDERVFRRTYLYMRKIRTLRDFQYVEDGNDQGVVVREKAQQVLVLLQNDQLLMEEREKTMSTRQAFQSGTAVGSTFKVKRCTGTKRQRPSAVCRLHCLERFAKREKIHNCSSDDDCNEIDQQTKPDTGKQETVDSEATLCAGVSKAACVAIAPAETTCFDSSVADETRAVSNSSPREVSRYVTNSGMFTSDDCERILKKMKSSGDSGFRHALLENDLDSEFDRLCHRSRRRSISVAEASNDSSSRSAVPSDGGLVMSGVENTCPVSRQRNYQPLKSGVTGLVVSGLQKTCPVSRRDYQPLTSGAPGGRIPFIYEAGSWLEVLVFSLAVMAVRGLYRRVFPSITYTCPNCGNATHFATQAEYDNHMRDVHQITT